MNKIVIFVSLGVVIIILIGIIGFLIIPSPAEIARCQEKANNRTGLSHIDFCYRQCCEKPLFIKQSCDNSCFMID